MLATPFTVLDQEKLRARIVAGRELRGITQAELGDKFAEDGLGKHDPGRIERGQMTMQRAHCDAFVRHLRLPERWFADEDTDRLIATDPNPTVDDAVVATLRRLAKLEPREMPGWLGRLGEADPTTAEDRLEEGPPLAGDAQ